MEPALVDHKLQVFVQFPLLRYAATKWYKHAGEVTEEAMSKRLVDLSYSLLGGSTVLAKWVEIHDPTPYWFRKHTRQPQQEILATDLGFPN